PDRLELDAEEEAAATDRAKDARVAARELVEARAELAAARARALDEAGPERGRPGEPQRAREVVVGGRRAVSRRDTLRARGARRDRRRERDEAAAERLREHEQVGPHAELLGAEERPGASEARLDFIEDQEGAVLRTELAHAREILRAGLAHAAFALDRLED